MGKQRRQLTAALAACLLFLSISITVSSYEKLCTTDSTTEACKAVYDTTEDADAEVPLAPKNPDNDIEKEVHGNPSVIEDSEVPDGEDEILEEADDWAHCLDRHEDCATLAEENECHTNPGFMYYQCADSCNTCVDFYSIPENVEICTDNDPSCLSWAKSGECAFNPSYMHQECRRSCLRCFVDT